MISIFTDASVDNANSNMAAGCLVLQDNVFKGQTSFTCNKKCGSGYAEVWGAIKAINYAKSICTDFDIQDKILYTDSHSCVRSASGISEDDVERQKLDKKFRILLDKYNVNVQLVEGHAIRQNPNKVVDSAARRAMRSKRR